MKKTLVLLGIAFLAGATGALAQASDPLNLGGAPDVPSLANPAGDDAADMSPQDAAPAPGRPAAAPALQGAAPRPGLPAAGAAPRPNGAPAPGMAGGPPRGPGMAAPAQRQAGPGSPPKAPDQPDGSPIPIYDDPGLRDLSNTTARQVYEYEMETRRLRAQLEVEKAKADVARAIGERKTTSPAPAAGVVASPAANLAPPVDPVAQQRALLPNITLRWIAGADGKLEANINVARYGQIVVRRGARIPLSDDVIVHSIRPEGLMLQTKTGVLIPIGFGGA